jgi:serine/threonine protein kinase
MSRGYIAPELSLAEPTASTKSDVYSFGVILLETISLMCATSEKGRPRDAKEWVGFIYCTGKQSRNNNIFIIQLSE